MQAQLMQRPSPSDQSTLVSLDGSSTSSSSATTAAMTSSSSSSSVVTTGPVVMEEKKLLKRAANRRSAQLSRKRKKQFIVELKEENDELRRKEQILKSIPDLIVVFDSSGKLWFVSHSVSRFLDFVPHDLEGSSFWSRLCDESVRLLKAAFMDALAARQKEMDTTPLGSGVWELRLVDRDGTHKVVSLNGVVHFSGDAPECVCSMRPRDLDTKQQHPQNPLQQHQSLLLQQQVKPQQSVLSNSSNNSQASSSTGTTTSSSSTNQDANSNSITATTDSSATTITTNATAAQQQHEQQQTATTRPSKRQKSNKSNNNNGRIAQISDGDSSVVSESGSE
eukprot:CAMPEP_0118689784 /NCGR_PEP_ID=MMETSP0800-20121206/9688_1 /TAXON_ID=210618 ORGANISM="Striatella unipunctata, Strain CCMP2910" /NCGR_SAMPLE_ID=MMETSP0800 /ASSEMBLY_ACC=CAM_ASM_000638 /LENGTH=335 /DNA_ID=CAMNT_0006587233 /DNA_START=178 /DNA_END=1185 /DNA_ORIENTATION=+